jgi:hypothetical protein
MSYKEKRKFPLHHKGFSPRAGTGDYYQRYNVLQNQRKVIGQKQGVASTTSEEDVSQVETCIYCDYKIPKTSEEQVDRTEVCDYKIPKTSEEQVDWTEVCVTESPPKKRRRKRDKVASAIKE